MNAYCITCHRMQPMINPAYSVNAIDRMICRGNCFACNSVMYKILGINEFPN